MLADKYPGLYKNPLDFSFKKGNFSFYFPLGTSILISVILTLGPVNYLYNELYNFYTLYSLQVD